VVSDEKTQRNRKTVICNEGIKIVIKAINNRMGKFVQQNVSKDERGKEKREDGICMLSVTNLREKIRDVD
jgi:hypothetical protein